MIRLQNLALPLSYQKEDLPRIAAKRLGISPKRILSCSLFRRAVDARDKGDLHFVATLSSPWRGRRTR